MTRIRIAIYDKGGQVVISGANSEEPTVEKLGTMDNIDEDKLFEAYEKVQEAIKE